MTAATPLRWPRLTLPVNAPPVPVRVVHADLVPSRDDGEIVLRLKVSAAAPYGEGALFFDWAHVRAMFVSSGLLDETLLPPITRETWEQHAQIELALTTPHLQIERRQSPGGVITTRIRPYRPSSATQHTHGYHAMELAAAVDAAATALTPVYARHGLLLGPREALEAGRAVLARSTRSPRA